MGILIRAVLWFGEIMSTALLVRAIMSWFVNMSRSDIVHKIYDLLYRFTEPIVGPVRNFMYSRFNTGPVDFSVFIAMLLIQIATGVIVRILLLIA